MNGTPRSKEFDDVYFSQEDGLAETRYVFLQGNGLPAAWAGKARFVIAETGFGTGLNFLAAWKLWRETAEPGAVLEYVSFEKFPLTSAQIGEYLSPWDELKDELTALCASYPPILPGLHRIMLPGVVLTLVFDDVNKAMPEMEANVDCWFLDGFKPSTNPDMWSETVFQNMARLSKPGATFATFTAAGFVKRSLRTAGFQAGKIKGFGTKWAMLVGKKL